MPDDWWPDEMSVTAKQWTAAEPALGFVMPRGDAATRESQVQALRLAMWMATEGTKP